MSCFLSCQANRLDLQLRETCSELQPASPTRLLPNSTKVVFPGKDTSSSAVMLLVIEYFAKSLKVTRNDTVE